MSKSSRLKKLYEQLQVSSTDDRILLSKVRLGDASKDEINELLDLIQTTQNGGKILDKIKDFEKSLITDFNKQIRALEEMEEESIYIAHLEDESEKEIRETNMKNRYEKITSKAEEILDAIKIAYFQIDNFSYYEEQLYFAKEPLTFLD